MSQTITVVTAIGSAATAIGVIAAVFTLKANHDWNRRQFAAKMIEDWNPRTFIHRRAIEKIKPGLVDLDKNKHLPEITKEEAAKIYDSQPDSKEWELRFHIIELLNYFEYVAACYYNGVTDEQMLNESFKNVVIMWHKILHNFIEVFGTRRGYQEPHKSWGPYHDLVEEWSTGKRIRRSQTDSMFSQFLARKKSQG